jgi:hypothetical protein
MVSNSSLEFFAEAVHLLESYIGLHRATILCLGTSGLEFEEVD